MNKTRNILLVFFGVVLVAGVAILGYTAYEKSTQKDTPLVFAKNQMLLELWSDYKKSNIEQSSGRTLDKSQDNITTSEGQSYTMLRSAWMDDRDTFDKSWQWTKDNLQRDDNLMSWKFGKLSNGKYGVQNSVGGQNTATDGDSDIALSLLMAYSRWGDDDYLYDAKPIIKSIWEKEVVQIDKKPVLVSNDLERKNDKVIVNPSYFSPYAYKIFANVDKDHDWKGLADNSYDILKRVSDEKLGSSSSAGLPPDWVTIDKETNKISAPTQENLTTNYSYDAFRTPWRLALDWKWFKDPRDKEVLQRYSKLSDAWSQQQKLVASYKHDGTPNADYEAPAMYGASLGYFDVQNPSEAKQIYTKKLLKFYDPNKQSYVSELSYYDENWTWFGMALHLDQLPNLTDVSKDR